MFSTGIRPEFRYIARVLGAVAALILGGSSHPATAKAPSAPKPWTAHVQPYVFLPSEKPYIVIGGPQGEDYTVRVYAVDFRRHLEDREAWKKGKPLVTWSRRLGAAAPGDARVVPMPPTSAPSSFLRPSGPPRPRSRERIYLPIHQPGAFIATIMDEGWIERSKGVSRRVPSPLWSRQTESLLLISDIGLFIKTAKRTNDVVVRAVDLGTGRAVAQCAVELRTGEENQTAARGITDTDGLLHLKLDGGSEIQVLAALGSRFAYARKDSYGARFSSEDVAVMANGRRGRSWNSDEPYRLHFSTDRPVYRPGQTAYFKGILRQETETGYRPLVREPVTIEVTSEVTTPREYTSPLKTTLTTNANGTFSGQVSLPEDAPLGRYLVGIATRDHTFGSEEITVSAYRKPEFKFSITPTRDILLRGDAVSADVKASYYFGGPVAGAKVHYDISAVPDKFSLSTRPAPDSEFPERVGEADEADQEESGRGWYVGGGDLILDAQGVARVTVPAQKENRPVRYTLSCSVLDSTRRPIRRNASVTVLPAATLVDLWPERWNQNFWKGQVVKFAIRTADAVTKMPSAARVAVTVERVTRQWSAGRFTESATPVGETSVTTDARGAATYAFRALRFGKYRVRARVTDEQNRVSEAEQRIEVSDIATPWQDEARSAPTLPLEIQTDKRRYAPGETAKVRIRSTIPATEVWLTIEARNVKESRFVRLTNGVGTVELPITDALQPTIYLAAVTAHQFQFLQTEPIDVAISVRDRLLSVTVTPDKPEYQPGDTARYTIRTTDHKGHPVSAEVAFGVVDAAVYGIVGDYSPDIRPFFWSPIPHDVQTFTSLALRDPNVELGYAPASLGSAGGMGSGVAISFIEGTFDSDRDEMRRGSLRHNFQDTAYWQPSVVTGSDGTATVTFDLPDNLTAWRATARAVTPDTRVGETRSEVRARKPLTARLALPRFITQGDTLTVSGIVRNDSPETVNATVLLTSPGPGIAIAGDAQRRALTLAPNEEKRLDWTAHGVLASPSLITLRADGGTVADGMQLPLPTVPYGSFSTITSSGRLPDQGIVKAFTLPGGRTTSRDHLLVTVAPSLAAVALGAADDLAEYPYGCIEQTLSRFVPDLVLERLVKERSAKHPQRDDLPKMVHDGLKRVNVLQHQRGGWAFAGDEDDPYFTALAVEALLTAQEAGYPVEPEVLRRGIAALRRMTELPTEGDDWGRHSAPRVLYALSLIAPDEAKPMVDSLWQRGRDTDVISTAYLTRAAVNVGLADVAKEGATRLRAKAISALNGVHWKAEGIYWYLEQDTLATAEAIRALVAVDKNDPLVLPAFHYLMIERKGRSWISTNDTAAVLYAVADYERTHPVKRDHLSGARIVLNGKTVQTVQFTDRDLFAPEVMVRLDSAHLPAGRNEIEILPLDMGDNPVYYTLALRYFQPAPPSSTIEPVVAGVRVERTYLKRVPKPENRQPLGGEQDDHYELIPFGGQARSGDDIVVKLVVKADSDIGYALIEDPFPAGCEPARQVDSEYNFDRYESGGREWRRETYDDRVVFLSERLRKGETVLTYRLRTVTPGVFHAPGAHAFAMYLPEVNGSAKSAILTVTDNAAEAPALAAP